MTSYRRPFFLLKKISRAKEFMNALKYFILTQLFMAILMIAFGSGEKKILQVFLGVPPLLFLVFGGKKRTIIIFYYICLLFVMGQRTLYLGEYFRIVPSAIILWGLAFIALAIRPQKVPGIPLPAPVLILGFASAAAIVLGAVDNRNLNLGFSYAHMMWLSIPAFFVCHRVVHRMEQIQSVVTMLSFSCIFLSFLGIAEYQGFGFVKYFSGFMKGETLIGQEGAARMAATFWGSPHLASYLGLCFPLILAQFFSSRTMTQKTFSCLGLVLTFVAIYLAGHRGVWVPVLAGIALYFHFRGAKGIVILMILIALGIYFVPKSAVERMQGLAGERRDSSSVKREERARGALELIVKSPFLGHGWGASGLVHSDPLQIWADSGIFGFVGFMGCFFVIWIRLFRISKIRDSLYKDYFRGFFVSVFVGFTILLQQAWLNLPENYTPFWVIMGLAYQLPNILFIEKKIALGQAQASTGKSEDTKKNA